MRRKNHTWTWRGVIYKKKVIWIALIFGNKIVWSFFSYSFRNVNHKGWILDSMCLIKIYFSNYLIHNIRFTSKILFLQYNPKILFLHLCSRFLCLYLISIFLFPFYTSMALALPQFFLCYLIHISEMYGHHIIIITLNGFKRLDLNMQY